MRKKIYQSKCGIPPKIFGRHPKPKNGRIGPKKAQNSNHSKKSKSQKTKILQNESYQ